MLSTSMQAGEARQRVVRVAEVPEDVVDAVAFGRRRCASIIDRGVGHEQIGERVPVTMVDRVSVPTEKLVDEDDVGSFDHRPTVRARQGRLPTGEVGVGVK